MAKSKKLKPGKAYQQSGKAKDMPSWRVATSETGYLQDPEGLDVFFDTAREAEQAYRNRQARAATA
ncbi:hypothetical protein ABIC83_002984 [Roseateles asaccharophilus]|uniref:hypothetical protein n=1 Tax=Roseateles asaccharophilus TaxID=582607 RepID=UPI003835F04E